VTVLRPCIECGTPADGTRCPSCEAERQAALDVRRGTPTDRGYDSAWARLSRRARRLQPWCLDCGTTEDLTADHKRWPARSLADVAVVCRPCNSRRGATRGANRHGGVLTPPPQAIFGSHTPAGAP